MKRQSLAAALLATAAASPAFAQYTITTLASFDEADGANPLAGVTASGSTLYGTTSDGGIYSISGGVVFSLPVTGGTPTVLASFNPSGNYGADPVGGVVLSSDGSTLYGTTAYDGPGGMNGQNEGVAFSLPTSAVNGTPTVLASFNFATTAVNVRSGVVLSSDGSTLYGTAYEGGPGGQGEVYSVPTSAANVTPTLLTSFNGYNGAYPLAGVTLSSGGSTLYGTTSDGGASYLVGTPVYGDGEVFSVPTSGGPATPLVSFTGTGGAYPGASPVANLILSKDGSTLYGTTSSGGANGDGEVFSVSTTGSNFTVLGSFDGANGDDPQSGLILSNGILYGTTTSGGAYGYGDVFSVADLGGPISVLASFDGADGANPYAGLTLSNGIFYGTTYTGGDDDEGTVFKLSVPEPASTGLVVIACVAALSRRRCRQPNGGKPPDIRV